MTAPEKTAKDDVIKQESLDLAVEDVDLDALFHAIAEVVGGGTTYEDVKNAFKQNVDPEKAKEKKNKKSK